MHTFTLERPLLVFEPGRFRHIHLPMQIRKSRNASHCQQLLPGFITYYNRRIMHSTLVIYI